MKIYPLLILFVIFISCTKNDKKPEFETEAYATIEIKQPQQKVDSIEASIIIVSIFPDDSRQEKYTLTETNEFIHLLKDRASHVVLNINNSSQNLWLSPNDTTTINLSESGEIESFSGKFKKENEYYRAKKNKLGFHTIAVPYNRILQTLDSYDQVKFKTDSLFKLELSFLENYSQDLPKDFMEFEKNEINYFSADLKAIFPLYNQFMPIIKEPLPDNYYDFVKHLKLNNTHAISTNSYFGFLTNYFWRDVDQNKLRALNGKERSTYLKNHLLNNVNEYLEPEIRDYFLAHHLTDMIKFFEKDELDSIAEKWEIKINKDLLEKIVAQKINSNEVYEEGSQIADFEMKNEKGEIVRISDFKDKIIYLNFWGTWCKPCIANIPELNEFIESYQENEEILFINLAIRSNEDQWKESIQKFELNGLNLFIPQGEKHDKLRTKFGASGVPHYAIIGKDNILKVNYANKAPAVKKEIDKLLSSNN